MLSFYALVVVALALGAVQLLVSRPRLPAGAKPLPGPKGLPIIGNVFELKKGEKGYFWFKFTDWGREHGPIYQYKAFGKVNVVIGKERIANELLRERGDIYSSRENLPMASQLLSDNRKALFLPYGDTWRKVRKLQHHVTQVKAATSYQPLQTKESSRLVHDLIIDPKRYKTLLRRYASALILRLTYGSKIQTGEEDVVRLVYENQVNVERVSAPGQYLVDVVPLLMYLPTWMAPFKQEAYAHRKREVSLFSSLVDDVARDVKAGKAGQSFTRMWLENKQKWQLDDLQGTYVLGGLYSAAASTTAALAMSWILMMVLNPQWLVKVQEEVDGIVGPDRLPEFEDLPHLPILRAVVKEVARMRPVTAAGIAHKTTQDDVYDGYFIPKGAIVHANQWAIHHDPELYPNPQHFNPERWLSPKFPTYREPLTLHPNISNYSVFGFGRRLCPGAHIAERSINIISARLAWACNIGKATDPRTGAKVAPPEYEYVRGASNTEPLPFDFELECRSPERWEVLEKASKQATEDLRMTEEEKDF